MTASPSAPETRKGKARTGLWVGILSALGFGAWWAASFFLHTALFGMVYVAAPTKPAKSGQSGEFGMTINPNRVRDIVAEIRGVEKKEFEQKVEELARIKEELDRLNAEKLRQYHAIMREEMVNAPDVLAASAADAVNAQEEAVVAQEKAEEALGKLQEAYGKYKAAGNEEEKNAAEAEISTATHAAKDAARAAEVAQRRAAAAQSKTGQQLQLLGENQAALEAHAAAEESQARAEKLQQNAEAVLDRAARDRKALETSAETLAKEQASLNKAQEQRSAAEKNLTARKDNQSSAETALNQIRTEAEAANTPAAEAEKNPANEAASDKKRLANEAKAAAEKLKKQEAAATKAAKDLVTAEAQLKKAEETLAKQQKKAEEAAAGLEAKKQSLDKTVALTSTEQKNSTAAQKASLELQRSAKEAILTAASKVNRSQTGSEFAGDATVIPVQKPAAGDGLADLYKKAREAEDAVTETFKNLRAAELAAIRKIPLSEAMELTEVAKTERPELNTEIMNSDISDVKGVREQEKTIVAAKDQMDAMVALGRRMKEIATDTGTGLSIAQIKAQSAHSEQMELLAMEDAGEKAKDLSSAMGGGGANGAVTAGNSPKAPVPAGPGSTGADERGPGGGGIVAVPVKDYKPLHGRTVRKGMASVEEGRNPAWLFVDTWNMIGPFPNPGRKNLNTKFPPETVVDLDAVYQGGRKDEKPIPVHWKFFQMPYQVRGKERTPIIKRITPPDMEDYEIFYAFTELWFDEAADLWVAIGSDDQSKVWINDQLIWKSGDVQKDWAPNEGLRKVHFRKGINRVLLRLENGQFSGGFSFMVCLSEPG